MPSTEVALRLASTGAHVIVHGRNRVECMMRLRRALDEFVVDGIKTTLPLFRDLVGNPDIDLPPGVSTLGPVYLPLPAELEGTNIFGITGHTHQWGTDVEVGFQQGEGGTPTMLYDIGNFNWEEPDPDEDGGRAVRPQAEGRAEVRIGDPRQETS